MHKIFYGLFGVAAIVVASGTTMFCLEVGLPGQKMNGKDCSFKFLDMEYDMQLAETRDPVIVTCHEDDFAVPMVEPTPYFLVSPNFVDWITRKPIEFETGDEIDGNALIDKLESIYEHNSNAAIELIDGKYKLIPEVVGNDFEVNAAFAAIACGYSDITYLCKEPEVTAKDLKTDFENVEWLNDFEVSYTSGYTIDGEDLLEYVNAFNLEVTLEDCEELVTPLEDDYNTIGGSYEYTDKDGVHHRIPYKTFGKKVKIEETAEELLNYINERESIENLEPVLSGYDSIKDTYVTVSIDDQHLWYYKDNVVLMDTDIVTGRKGVHDTPTGVYYISECIPGKYLVGDTYKTWVNRWMRLTNSGIGLHDATWRGRFGGNIYSYDGSHGCINLPKNWAYEFYKDAYVGMPVIIY